MLSKVNSTAMKEKLLAILHSEASHNDRKYLVHFLRYVNYSDSDILKIIDIHNKWTDYSKKITAYQIKSLKSGENARSMNKAYRVGDDKVVNNLKTHHHGVRDRYWTECHLTW
jgi:hypothetical protein